MVNVFWRPFFSPSGALYQENISIYVVQMSDSNLLLGLLLALIGTLAKVLIGEIAATFLACQSYICQCHILQFKVLRDLQSQTL